MEYNSTNQHITDDERRNFLKALGVGGGVAVGSMTLTDVRDALSEESADQFASIGSAIRSDLTGTLDAESIAAGQATFAEHARSLPTAAEKGLPGNGPRDEFESVAQAGQPLYDHLADAGFFESTTNHLPKLTPTNLESSVRAFVNSEALSAPLGELGLDGQAGVDLVATVVANAKELSTHHWVATDEIPRERLERGEFIPPMTQAAAGGILLWLGDIDQHLWQKKPILTEQILDDAIWHGQSMAAGFHLMSEGAKAITGESSGISDEELGSLLTTGFAVQAIAQGLLPKDVYWITEEMRGPQRTDLETITE